jgi:hypothetical protein
LKANGIEYDERYISHLG